MANYLYNSLRNANKKKYYEIMFAAVPEVKYAKDSLQSNCKGFPSKHCQNLVTLLDCNKTNFFSKFK